MPLVMLQVSVILLPGQVLPGASLSGALCFVSVSSQTCGQSNKHRLRHEANCVRFCGGRWQRRDFFKHYGRKVSEVRMGTMKRLLGHYPVESSHDGYCQSWLDPRVHLMKIIQAGGLAGGSYVISWPQSTQSEVSCGHLCFCGKPWN